jgi:EEF1A N-terminal glycine/lysine methyltransferase
MVWFVQDPGTLFNHFLWNGARLLVHYLQIHPETCAAKSVLELGAAAAVPSIVASLCGAATVVASDYPDPRIVEVMQLNMKENTRVLADNGAVAPSVCGKLGAAFLR